MTQILPGEPGRTYISGAPEGLDARIVSDEVAQGHDIIFIARDDVGLARFVQNIEFFAPDIKCFKFPAWDCLPYDRVSPRNDIVSTRIDTLCRLLNPKLDKKGRILATTVSSFLQRVPARSNFHDSRFDAMVGELIDPIALTRFLDGSGYARVDTVMEPGEYAVRGGIIDAYPSGSETPFRLDFFGDELERLRSFDPITQRSKGENVEQIKGLTFRPVSEVVLTTKTIENFRSNYRTTFGRAGDDDPLYTAISAGQRYIGMEHWLPLFYEKLEMLTDYMPDAAVFLDHQAEEARDGRLDLVHEYFSARQIFNESKSAASGSIGGAPYYPINPETLYLDETHWEDALVGRRVGYLSPFAAPENVRNYVDAGGHGGKNFSDVRIQPDVSVYDAVCEYVKTEIRSGQRVLIAAYSDGSLDRLRNVLGEHGLLETVVVGNWQDAMAQDLRLCVFNLLELDRGFRMEGLTLLTEQDILGDRMIRPARHRIKAENFIAEASSLAEGDMVVHMEHGIGQFDGLEAIQVGGAPHDCLRLIYSGGDKLFLPVENIEVISRYGSEDAGAHLDRLGGAAWQARKSKMKARIRVMADKLIAVAAAREVRKTDQLAVPEGVYDEFCARFAFSETEDQARAIADTLCDLASGQPVDRLVCGDVGFGKTEVAMRAAFVTAMSGKQVAIVVPTTLLARQHYRNFVERFEGFPVRIAQLSRMVPAKQANTTKAEMKVGKVDVVVGTHALIAKDVGFQNLGLLIIDEEQHFGVSHKERLKQIKADVHVLTLTATPIPRTLQLALSGIREMSLIATPPVDRLAVRTFVMPFDPVVIREAILRERFRGGQTFFVCPRLADIAVVEDQLLALLPEVKIGIAHGRLSPTELEGVIGQFYEGTFDVLLSTNIVESGLDLPSVNTMIIYRADMFGLAQLYQLRGRVGRSKTRAYAYLTLPPKKTLTKTATRRLEVMQTLDQLGAGFSLASHDLDIRGAGNLLGDEQTGHIREVGVELYQQMLEEAVAEARGIEDSTLSDDEWSPQISTGVPVLIPDYYVTDLSVRMGLYRRLAWLHDQSDIDGFGAELIDRFGPIPDEAENLIKTISLKNLCKKAGIEKVDAGPKGAVVAFRNSDFANLGGLVQFLTDQKGTAKLRPDHKLVFMRSWGSSADRFEGVRYLVGELAKVAAA
jgi:transcription-repair coupling factor (superfamily II helicase)